MKQDDVYEIDILKLASLLIRKSWLIISVAVLCAILVFANTLFFVTPQYTASVLMYVNNSSISIGGQSLSISSGELSAAKTLVDTYRIILNTRLTLEEVNDSAGLNYTYEQLSAMISSEAVNNTEIFRVNVTDSDPQEACLIANTISRVLPKKIATVVDGSSVRTVDLAVVPTKMSSPNYTKNTLIGFFVGFFAMCAIIVVRELFREDIDSEEWFKETFGEKYPILSIIPDQGDPNSSKYGYKYYKSFYYKYDRYGYYESEKHKQVKEK